MAAESASPQSLSVEGQVIEILERGGQRRARVCLEAHTVLDVSMAELGDLHLGDRVTITGTLAIERVRQD